MADKKISELAAVTDVVSGDEYVLSRSGVSKKIDADDLSAGIAALYPPSDASSVGVTDTGGNYTATDVEGVLAEIAPQLGSGGPSTSTMLGYPFVGTITAIGSTNLFGVRVWLSHEATFTRYLFRIGTSSGNMDLGIYDALGSAVTREGSFAVPASGRATRTLGVGSVTLSAGEYILAAQFDNSSATVGLSSTSSQDMVSYTPTNTFPLPSTMTLTTGGTGIALMLIP